jgi:hypothetical protein
MVGCVQTTAAQAWRDHGYRLSFRGACRNANSLDVCLRIDGFTLISARTHTAHGPPPHAGSGRDATNVITPNNTRQQLDATFDCQCFASSPATIEVVNISSFFALKFAT